MIFPILSNIWIEQIPHELTNIFHNFPSLADIIRIDFRKDERNGAIVYLRITELNLF